LWQLELKLLKKSVNKNIKITINYKIMKNTLTTLLLLTAFFTQAQVGIGVSTADINPSAQLEVSSTTKGFLAPRMTESEKNTIASPAVGLLVYQTNGTKGFYSYNGTVWVAIATTEFVTSAVSTAITEISDEITATIGQTSFNITHAKGTNRTIKMYINGIRISNTAYSVSSTTVTYNSANNGGYTIVAGDRIQFDFSY
jgi:hypothetical protein